MSNAFSDSVLIRHVPGRSCPLAQLTKLQWSFNLDGRKIAAIYRGPDSSFVVYVHGWTGYFSSTKLCVEVPGEWVVGVRNPGG